MSESICLFMPSKKYAFDVRPVHFVLEAEFHKLTQPFFYSLYYLHLITKGEATLHTGNGDFKLKRGDIFFAFAACLYEIDGSDDLEYMYVSFLGSGAPNLLASLGVTAEAPVYRDLPDSLIEFWESAISRVNKSNITVLTEGVLYYTLSYVCRDPDEDPSRSGDGLMTRLTDYIEKHYRDPDMSLSHLASVFSYTEKYLSSFFKKSANIPFRQYLNRLRIQYALNLIAQGETAVGEIARKCGYSDPTYFSKVFKQICGKTPSEYIVTAEPQ